MIIAVINLMTNKKVFFTKKGANSLYIYVWHGFFIKLLLMLHFFSYIINNFSIYAVLISLVMLSVFIVYILSFPLVKKITQKIILNPISRVLLIKS